MTQLTPRNHVAPGFFDEHTPAEEVDFNDFDAFKLLERLDDHILIGTEEADALLLQEKTHVVVGHDGEDSLELGFATEALLGVVFDEGALTLLTEGKHIQVEEVETLVFTDATVAIGDVETTFSEILIDHDALFDNDLDGHVLQGTQESDALTLDDEYVVNGDEGEDTLTLPFASSAVEGVFIAQDVVEIFTDEEHYELISIEEFIFTDKTVSLDALATEFADVLIDDLDFEGIGDIDLDEHFVEGTEGDDALVVEESTHVVDGLGGTDTVELGIASSAVEALVVGDAFVMLITEDRQLKIEQVEQFVFTDVTVEFSALESQFSDVLIEAPEDIADDLLEFDFHRGQGRDDFIDGGEGEDTVVFDLATDEIEQVIIEPEHIIFFSPNGVDTFRSIELFEFADQTVKAEDLETVFADVVEVIDTVDDQEADAEDDDDVKVGTDLGDTFDLSEDEDEATFDFDLEALLGLENSGGLITVVTDKGVSFLQEVERFAFRDDYEFDVEDIIFGSIGGEKLIGSSDDDFISAAEGEGDIEAGDGNDFILNAEIGELIDGGHGLDTVKFLFDTLGITAAKRKIDGSVEIETEEGLATLRDVEQLIFGNDSIIDIDQFVAGQNIGIPVFLVPDGNGGSIEATPDVYSGPVSYLEFQILGDVEGNVITGAASNDFINVGAGDDAANGGDGEDILDGGTGSNFLTGGNGGDTFYIDGRGVLVDAASTWSTISDFSADAGDSVNIWGWIEGTSQLLSTKRAGENASGAEGFEGFTHHYDLDGDGTIDTSITFTGLDASPETNEAREILDLGYQFYGA